MSASVRPSSLITRYVQTPAMDRQHHLRRLVYGAVVLSTLLASDLSAARAGSNKSSAPRNLDWATSNGSPGNLHYSPLKQFDVANVARLEPVWSFDTHETGGLETQPKLATGGVYVAFALPQS